MKKLIFISLSLFSTIVFLTACGENRTENTSTNETQILEIDSTSTTNKIIKDTTKN